MTIQGAASAQAQNCPPETGSKPGETTGSFTAAGYSRSSPRWIFSGSSIPGPAPASCSISSSCASYTAPCARFRTCQTRSRRSIEAPKQIPHEFSYHPPDQRTGLVTLT